MRGFERRVNRFLLKLFEGRNPQSKLPPSFAACKIAGKSAGINSSDFAKITACSMAFFNSRTLPGHA